MPDFMVVSHVLLWVGFFTLLATVFALLRQVGVLFERVAPAGALAIGSQLEAGDAAPTMRLTALSGKVLDVGAHRLDGVTTLLLFVSPNCPICEHLLPVAKSIARRRSRVRVVYASAGEDVQAQERFVAAVGLPRDTYVISDALGMAFGAAKLPFAALITPDARIASLGLVNTREHLESLFEARRLGVASLQDYMSRHASATSPALEAGVDADTVTPQPVAGR